MLWNGSATFATDDSSTDVLGKKLSTEDVKDKMLSLMPDEI